MYINPDLIYKSLSLLIPFIISSVDSYIHKYMCFVWLSSNIHVHAWFILIIMFSCIHKTMPDIRSHSPWLHAYIPMKFYTYTYLPLVLSRILMHTFFVDPLWIDPSVGFLFWLLVISFQREPIHLCSHPCFNVLIPALYLIITYVDPYMAWLLF